MRNRTMALAAATLALVVVAGTGCVSKKMFRSNMEGTDTRVTSVENAVEANERRITDIKTETDRKLAAVRETADKALSTGSQAMSKADAATSTANQAAMGKLLWSVTMTDDKVKFALNQAKLSAEGMAMLDRMAQQVKSYGKAVYLEIEGHTDSSGPEAYNQKLGHERAMAVMTYLNQKAGIPLHAMNTISYGETQPVADNSTSAGRSQNRRVVIKVLE